MVTYGSLAAQIELEAGRSPVATHGLLPFPADLLLGFGHIVAEGEEWPDGLDAATADAA